MKIIAIGDIHGRDFWKKVVEKETFDKIVFIGDYFDSFNIPGHIQLENFKEIVDYKNSNSDKVVLLCGNHDYHYLKGVDGQCSGYQLGMSYSFNEALQPLYNNKDLKICFKHKGLLFTHAGVSKTWVKQNNIDLEDLENSMNDYFYYKPKVFDFNLGSNFSYYGDDVCQTPIWIRPNSLEKDSIDNYFQIVGHTHHDNITFKNNLVFIDVLNRKSQYLIWEDGAFSIGTV